MAKNYPHQNVQHANSVEEIEALKRARDQEIEDFRHVMSDPRGRRFMWRVLDRSGIYRSSYTGNSETFFREGERNIGLMLLAEMMSICPESHIAMLQEKENGN